MSGGWGKAQRFTHEYLRKSSAEWPANIYASAREIAFARVRVEHSDLPEREPTTSEVETIRRAMRGLADQSHIIVRYIEGEMCGRITPVDERVKILKREIRQESSRRRRSPRE